MWLEIFFSLLHTCYITESINNSINLIEQIINGQSVAMSFWKRWELFTLQILFSFLKNRICFRGFSFCVEQRPLRTQSVSMLSSQQNSGRKSMRKKKRKRGKKDYYFWHLHFTCTSNNLRQVTLLHLMPGQG